ncbi:hypothetical protein BKA66DRAFT_411635 [Pyrenochaeta sp. MPI-SDFR-AT-0127]|nr:hypothetical protein BKA66DRAFT_411635 [Pyrenochaeta sp. MPI-SDFR-AT-0127]
MLKRPHTLDSISDQLLAKTSLVHAPKKAQEELLTGTIAELHLHPAIEALLHILNADLPSAHFLVRHMQAAPAVEGMLLHGILHRAEGDFDNARAWIGDVEDACEGFIPKKRNEGQQLDQEVNQKMQGGKGFAGSLVAYVYGEQNPRKLIDDVEHFRKKKQSQRAKDDEESIEERIRNELARVLEWCKGKFGTGQLADATSAWIENSEEISAISRDMVSGDKGYRDF